MEEIWKDIEGYEGLYQVSNLGSVKSLERDIVDTTGRSYIFEERVRKLYRDKDGYLAVRLYKEGVYKTFKVHRLVALAFVLNTQHKPQVNHKNGKKDDNGVENLEWVTPAENVEHSINTGLKNICGENNGQAKITEKQAGVIKYELKNVPLRRVAEMFGINYTTVSKIRSGKTWKNI